MLSLVRSGLLRMIACVMVFLPLCMLVAHVYTPYSSGSGRSFTFGLSLVEPVQSPYQSVQSLRQPIQSHELAPESQIPVSGTSVLGGPSLSADFINHVLSSAGSPAAGTGQALYDLSVESGIDDAYALAVFEKESSFGKYGAASQNHALGNIVCAGYPTCHGRFRWYPSWLVGEEDFYQLISREYVSRGLSTVETITPVYAPSSENNTGLYILQVRRSLLAFRQAQALVF
jgi:hypothetical protein